MTALVQAALTVQRGARDAFGYVAAGCIGLLVLLGFFRHPVGFGFEPVLLGSILIAVLGVRLSALMREERKRAGSGLGLLDLELGVLSLTAAQAVLQWFGGAQSRLHPLLYALMAFIGAFAERSVARRLVFYAIAFEAAVYFRIESQPELGSFALHAVLLALFGLLNPVLTQAEVGRVRLQNRRELRAERERARSDARLFRLAATPTASPASDEEQLTRSGVEEIHEALFFNLDLLRHTMGLHACVLLMADEVTHLLRVVEWSSQSDAIATGTFSPAKGAVGAAYQRGVTMALEQLRPGYPGLCYYREPAQVATFIAVPVREAGCVRGVLCADRLTDQPFSRADEELLEHAIGHLLRALENQRLLVQLERSKREHAVLARVAQALGAARTEQAVFEAVLGALCEIAPHDFAAVTRYDANTKVHCVRRAIGESAGRFINLRFADNASLTAMTVQNRHYLPYRGEFDPGSQVVYTRKANLEGMQSLLILPLLVRDDAIGTLALAARPREAFGEQLLPALAALASQLAVALSNVESLQRLEELATTDGLTGLYNKRYFNEHFEAKLSAAERFGRKLSLIITDIDHFKVVNDTHGHAFGDVVIRELGAILGRLKRQTDIVARFGGEEFCLLCEETDADGATRLAERVRQQLEAASFETEAGPLQVTCSLGVATYPDHARTLETLFEGADRALYKAKHAGRNQVCVG